jgi:ferredoxin-NADP reductase
MAAQWYTGKVISTANLGPAIKHLKVLVEGPDVFNFTAGQFVTFDLPVGEKRLQRWKSYSIANPPLQDNILEFCVVKLVDGLGSTYLVDVVKAGDILKFKAADGNFILPSVLDKDVVMICTGTGVAPFRSMLQHLDRNGGFTRKVHLIFGTRRKENILFQEEFEDLKARNPLFEYTIVLSQEKYWDGVKGYVHPIYLNEYATQRTDIQFYLCGWSNMVDQAVANLFVTLGYSRQQIVYELYGNKP